MRRRTGPWWWPPCRGPRRSRPAWPTASGPSWPGSGTSPIPTWSCWRTDVIPHGQPLQTPPLSIKRRVDLGGGLFVCGDHRDTASLQGAMFSGERTAAAVLGHLSTGG